MSDSAVSIGDMPAIASLDGSEMLELQKGTGAASGGRATLADVASNVRMPWPLVTVTAATTLALSHAQTWIKVNATGAVNITIPPESTVAWPAWTEIVLFQYGAGVPTIVAGSGVTVRKHASFTLAALGQYGTFGLKKIGTNEWLLFGLLGAV